MTGKKGIIWLILSCLIAAVLLLASCAGEVTKKTEVTPPTKEVTPAMKEVAPAVKAGTVKLSLKKLDGTPVEKWVEAPRYGGTFILALNTPNTGWDDFFTSPRNSSSAQLTINELLDGDWYRGPTGTEETTWFGEDFVLPFETGSLAESWEIPNAQTIIYHIRKGVHWQDKPPMNGRELTADDVAFNLNRIFLNPKSVRGKKVGIGIWFISATAVDKHTVVVKGKETETTGISLAFQQISESHYILPPEVIQKYGDMRDWRNVIGTGMFMVVDVVEGSSATFKRNPNYWGRDPLFPENQLPYLDQVRVLVIPDQSTQYAGLRTGKIDFVSGVSWENGEQLLKTNPELMWRRMLTTQFLDGLLTFRADTKPFDDIRVRRALAMAIDRPAILRDYYHGNAQLLSPVLDVPEFKGVYVPLEQFPESTRELWEYRPDKAKQLLAEAGYPQGFKFTAVLHKDFSDMASLYKAYLAKVGVNMELDLREFAVWVSMTKGLPKTYKEATFIDSAAKTWRTTVLPGHSGNYANISDPVINELMGKLTSFELMQNQAELDRLAKQMQLHIMSQAYEIAPPVPYIYTLWQPWVKNFYGLTGVGYDNFSETAVRRAWIDQGLKEKMGRR